MVAASGELVGRAFSGGVGAILVPEVGTGESRKVASVFNFISPTRLLLAVRGAAQSGGLPPSGRAAMVVAAETRGGIVHY